MGHGHRLWDSCDAALSSRLAYLEVCAALAASRRNHDLTARQCAVAEQTWDEFWSAIRAVELTPAIERQAGRLAGAHALRGAELIVAVWDRRLRAGVRAERLAVAPYDLP